MITNNYKMDNFPKDRNMFVRPKTFFEILNIGVSNFSQN